VKKFVLGLLMSGVIMSIGSVTPANAGIALPVAFVEINGVRETVPVDILNGKIFETNGGTPFTFVGTNGSTITVSATGNPDPFLAYSVSATTPDIGGTTSFLFDFGPFANAPCPPGSIISHTMSGSITSGNGDGVTITPDLNTFVATYTGDADIPAGSIDIGGSQTSPGTGTNPYPPSGIFSASQVAGPGGVSTLGVEVSFTLTNTNDSAAISGQINYAPAAIPEPGTVSLLMGISISSLGLLARRRRQR
jgi:hypothetical protein